MDKFLFIVTIILAFAWCCLAGFGGPGWQSDPNVKPIKDAVCDVNKRPDQTQWTELLKCRSYNKTGDPRHEKIVEMVRVIEIYRERIYFTIFFIKIFYLLKKISSKILIRNN
jgi:hypothetical protein